MPRDYAKQNYKEKSPPKYGRWVLLFLVVFCSIFAFGVGYTVFAHKHETPVFSKASLNAWLINLKSLVGHKNSASLPKPPATVAVNEDAPVHFDFYNELPTMQVNVPAMAASAKAPPLVTNKSLTRKVEMTKPAEVDAVIKSASTTATTAKKTNQYILQIGIFKDPVGASQLRVSLLLSGIDADVVKVNMDGEELYRVQQGPFGSQGVLKQKQARLLKKGVVSVGRKV